MTPLLHSAVDEKTRHKNVAQRVSHSFRKVPVNLTLTVSQHGCVGHACHGAACVLLCTTRNSGAKRCKALARHSKLAICQNFYSLASKGFLEHLKMPTDGANVCQDPATRC